MIASAIAFIGAMGTLGAVGLDVDRYRPTWIYEHSEVAQVVYHLQLQTLKQELYQLRLEADKMRRANQPVPEWIRSRIWELQEIIKQVSGKMQH